MGWAVQDISTSTLVTYFILVSHTFRMELFFLLAGAAFALKMNVVGVTPSTLLSTARPATIFACAWERVRLPNSFSACW